MFVLTAWEILYYRTRLNQVDIKGYVFTQVTIILKKEKLTNA